MNVYYATSQMIGKQEREGDVAVVFLNEAQRRIIELERALKLVITTKGKSSAELRMIAKKGLNGVLGNA